MHPSSTPQPFRNAASGRSYRKRRYGSFFQGLIARRENQLAERLLRRCRPEDERHIIDIPCGYGRFYPLLKRLGFRVSAMDQSQAMVELCREQPDFKTTDSAERADIMQALPPAADAASRALCVRLFQHLHEAPQRMQALRTLGGDGRHVVMTYYDSGCLHYWSKRLLMALKGKPVRINMITRTVFDAEVAAAGLEIEKRIKLLPGIHAQTWVLLRSPAAQGAV